MASITNNKNKKNDAKKETINPTKRILKDVIDIYKNPLTENNIY